MPGLKGGDNDSYRLIMRDLEMWEPSIYESERLHIPVHYYLKNKRDNNKRIPTRVETKVHLTIMFGWLPKEELVTGGVAYNFDSCFRSRFDGKHALFDEPLGVYYQFELPEFLGLRTDRRAMMMNTHIYDSIIWNLPWNFIGSEYENLIVPDIDCNITVWAEDYMKTELDNAVKEGRDLLGEMEE